MDSEEANRRFMSREPVQGLAFLLNDSVEVTGGLHHGARGSVLALDQLAPEPVYVVGLESGQDVRLLQSQIVGASAAASLADLQRWYSAQCDGDWEHSYGVTIGTLDNPGWSVVIELTDTALADAAFAEIKELEPEREWIFCRVVERRFEGHGGPHMLGRIIRTFLEWASQGPRGAG
jgi:hypothetical protein